MRGMQLVAQSNKKLVLDALTDDYQSTKQIASKLDMCQDTVRTHLYALVRDRLAHASGSPWRKRYKKLGVSLLSGVTESDLRGL